MLILEHNSPAYYAEQLENAKIELCDQIVQAPQTLLRKEFDAAHTDSIMQACIDIAKTLGFVKLAEEMQADMETEKLLTFLNND